MIYCFGLVCFSLMALLAGPDVLVNADCSAGFSNLQRRVTPADSLMDHLKRRGRCGCCHRCTNLEANHACSCCPDCGGRVKEFRVDTTQYPGYTWAPPKNSYGSSSKPKKSSPPYQSSQSTSSGDCTCCHACWNGYANTYCDCCADCDPSTYMKF